LKKQVVLIVLFPVFSICSFAQSGNEHFFVGAWGVSPDYRAPVLWSIRGVWNDTTDAPPEKAHLLLPLRRLRQVRELGLNLINVRIHERYVLREDNPEGINAVADVCAMARSESLDVVVEDPWLTNAFAGERLLFHPESAYDFHSHAAHHGVRMEEFDHIPIPNMNCSRSLLEDGLIANNCIVVRPGMEEISGLSWARIEELSVREQDAAHASAGRYHLSVIVRYDSTMLAVPPANDTCTVLRVRISTSSSDGTPVALNFSLPGSAFYWDPSPTAAIRDSAFEYVLGDIEVVRSTQPPRRVFVRRVLHRDEAWNDSTRFSGWKIRDVVGDSVAVFAELGDFDIRILPGFANSELLLDALCLTNPGTLALYYPNLHGLVDAHRHRRETVRTRLARLLHDGNPSEPFTNLRFLNSPEQIVRYAIWPTTRLFQLMVEEESASNVKVLLTSSAATDINTNGKLHTDYASGFYYYPILIEHPRPTLTHDENDVAAYYSSLQNPWRAGFIEMAKLYRSFVQRRGAVAVDLPWIPWIQNHSNLYRTDIPSFWDWMPHREPTAAELRQQCNTALAMGAGGIQFFSFCSAPWFTSDPFWPPDLDTWNEDVNSGYPRQLDMDMGVLGFLGAGNLPRRADWNGEDKWDSARTYISDFLRPVGDYMRSKRLRWISHRFWHMPASDPIAGGNTFVRYVRSQHRDEVQPYDAEHATLIQVSEFLDADSTPYLFILNGRTHPADGRHVQVALGDGGRLATHWKVTNILTEQSWLVSASDIMTDIQHERYFTDVLYPGTAALYRLEALFSMPADGPPILGTNYPNPFSDRTSFSYILTRPDHVRITVVDVLGRDVATLVNGYHEAGVHSAVFHAAGLANGVYLCRLATASLVLQRKILLTR